MVEVEVISTEELGDRSYIAHTDTHLSYVVDDGHGPWRCSPAGRCCIGIDRPAGAATGRPADLAPGENLRGYPAVTFADLAARSGAEAGEPVLDVRRNDERATGGIPWATHIPMQDLLERLDELPAGRLWIHCAAGYRAGIAAGLLDRAGRDVVLVDDDDNRAVELGLAPSWHHRSWPEASTGTPATTAPFSATTSRTMRCTPVLDVGGQLLAGRGPCHRADRDPGHPAPRPAAVVHGPHCRPGHRGHDGRKHPWVSAGGPAGPARDGSRRGSGVVGTGLGYVTGPGRARKRTGLHRPVGPARSRHRPAP
ncbi:rhodanese-like domain-containing protein [Pseudonocardia acidicola]|uniref:rhodanese-like domain-containing protein n=1 Tax=Pseudonocardia acidicola TaxID=2724939 RepID=UPI00308425F1